MAKSKNKRMAIWKHDEKTGGLPTWYTNEPTSTKRRQGGEGREKNFIFLSFLANTQTTPRVREEEKIETLFILLTNTHSARVKKTTTHNKHARDTEEKLRERIYFSFLYFHTHSARK
jgi:hypothetical protein